MRAVLIGPNGHHSCLAELKTTYRLETVAYFLDPAAALAFVRAGAEAPAVMVADVSAAHDPGADRALVELLDAATVCWPGCRVATVLGEAQRYLQGELHHAQARTFRPDQVDDLAAYLALVRCREAQARVVLALSAKGGVGKTSLIANLGTALTVRHGLRVAAVDGDLTRGDLARLLGVEPATTVLDLVADRSPGGISAALERYMVTVCDGRLSASPLDSLGGGLRGTLALLAAPGGALNGSQPWTALTTRHAQAVLAVLSERFDVVLLDTPPDLQRSSPFPAAVLGNKGLPFVGLVVIQPQPMERWGARQVLDFVAAYGTDHGLVRGVLVHRNPATGNARQLEKVLGVEIVEAIPYDPRAAAAHHATELVYDFDKKRLSPPARAYARLAEWLVEGGQP